MMPPQNMVKLCQEFESQIIVMIMFMRVIKIFTNSLIGFNL